MQTEIAPSRARGSLDRMASRLADEKHELVLFLIELADFDRDKLALELGYPSTLGCLMGELGLTESSACRRISAARLLARFPAIARPLLAHRLTVTGLVALKEVLDDGNVDQLLERAAGLSEPAVRELVMHVRMDAARPAPAPPPAAVATEVAVTAKVLPENPSVEDVTSPPPPSAAERDDRTALTLWVGGELRDELAAARSLLSHAVPSGRTEDLLLYVLRRVRTQHERKKYGGARGPKPAVATAEPSAKPAKSPPSRPRSAPAQVRRTTGQRETRSCAFVGVEGRRCGSTWQLEFQHIEPAARGGQATESNTTLFCRLHNRLQAERDFGTQHVARRIAASPRRRSAGHSRLQSPRRRTSRTQPRRWCIWASSASRPRKRRASQQPRCHLTATSRPCSARPCEFWCRRAARCPDPRRVAEAAIWGASPGAPAAGAVGEAGPASAASSGRDDCAVLRSRSDRSMPPVARRPDRLPTGSGQPVKTPVAAD